MKAQARRLWGWIRQHRVRSFIILIVLLIALLVGMALGTFWTVNLVRFGLPPPTGQNCGSIVHAYIPVEKTARADSELQSLTCFWQAYQTCQAATISQTLAATDAGHTDTLTLEERDNHCVMYGQEDWQVNTNSGTDTFLCTQLSKEGDELQVSACDGVESFDLSPRYVTRESYHCGVVGLVSTKDISQQIETCFFTAYQQCLADSLGYRTVVDGAWEERDFFIDNRCGIAYGTDIAPSYFSVSSDVTTCSSVVMRADGLHFSQCGTDGEVFVPMVPQQLQTVP